MRQRTRQNPNCATNTATGQYCNLSSIEGFNFDAITCKNAGQTPGANHDETSRRSLPTPRAYQFSDFPYRIACITGHEGSKEPE